MDHNYSHGSEHGLTPGLGSHHRPVTASQQTPSRRRNTEFDVWFLEFSNFYSLNLRRPNSTLSIEQTRGSPSYQEDWFYTALKDQYHQGNSEIVLRNFDMEARKVHSRWTKKSRPDLGVTPAYTELPRAVTEPERAHLLRRLTVVLEDLGPADDSQHSVSGPEDHWAKQDVSVVEVSLADEPLPSSDFRRPKRASDEWMNQQSSQKRSRATAHPSAHPPRPPSVLSRLDSGEVRAATPMPEPNVSLPVRDVRSSQQQASAGHGASFDTNKSSFVSAVFSEAEDSALQETQVTVEETTSYHRASSQHKSSVYHKLSIQQAHRRPEPPVDSDSAERRLQISFNERHNLQGDVAGLLASFEDEFSGVSDGDIDPEYLKLNQLVSDVGDMQRRLQSVWTSSSPEFVKNAPFAMHWEFMRVALHCGVPPEAIKDVQFRYQPRFENQSVFWDHLRKLAVFEGKVFPEKSRPEAWTAAMNEHFRSIDQVVVLTASLAVNQSAKGAGPLFNLSLQPLKLDFPHRLDRRFGSDRFIELLLPSLHSREMASLWKTGPVPDNILDWLTRDCHIFLGRLWRSFFTKDAAPKKIHKDDTLQKDTVTVFQERVYLFAENGNNFRSAQTLVSPAMEPTNGHTKMERDRLLDWLLQIRQHEVNQKQPICKLFSRIALGLSRTRPTVILEPEQIRRHDSDLLSPADKVMNDGIGRMSAALARQIRDRLGLSDTPAGFQGRFGSAKGFWIRDTEDQSDDIWIETFPSQRKWECDYEDEYHRTFEVLKEAKELRSATLNLQLLPILEDRAINKALMKKEIGRFMQESLKAEMEAQKDAMADAAQFRLWVHENAAPQRRQERVRSGSNCVPWLGGLPASKEDRMELLLCQGFDPRKLEFLRAIAFDIRKAKCDELQTKLNVKVGRSTYAYMTVDFLGVLEEDEVHLGFSSKFTDETSGSGFSETFLHGMDVLVARTPAHYPSDIQRVKAVFKPELGSLKDVIVFPTKGNIPLAEKLSGGDYDGDMAWVCWEPSIVQNFKNAELPQKPDLFAEKVLSKRKEMYKSLTSAPMSQDVTAEFMFQAFRFNMEQSLLGACTNYKEKLCYSRKCVSDEPAIYLSTLISHLVDRAKQGIVFSEKSWNELRRRLNGLQGHEMRSKAKADPPVPQYKNPTWGLTESPTHIIDYVKFVVGKPTVERELKELNAYLGKAEQYDKDLVEFYNYFDKFRRPLEVRKRDEEQGKFKKSSWETILEELKKNIDEVAEEWATTQSGTFEAKVARVYEKWQSIRPTGKVASNSARSLCEERLTTVGLSQWDLLKASYCFKMYSKRTSFVWWMAGYQLAYLKSIAVTGGKAAPPVLVTPEMYAGTKPDAKLIRAIAARNAGLRLGTVEELEDGDGSLEDDA
ncbi:hypothetical protein F5Y17DRAFT_476279 [Xylariaceae sp. FL0594]|nr:hypothetical protein F5Y17DRAFT_476279 [Xylariaceae sp. FL0594]